MLLVVDVGNTNTVMGVFAQHSSTVLTTVRMSTRRDRMPDEWYAIIAPVLASAGIEPRGITGVALSSVVPNVTRWLTEMCRLHLGVEPLVVSASLDLGIGIDYDNPSEIGADRLVNSLAASTKYGAPVISIDVGTAINFDVVDESGNYVGGALAPGLVISLEAMASRAARLFSVELVPPPTAIARSTTNAIQSGLVLGFISLIEGMVERIRGELKGEPKIVITGGYAEMFAQHTDVIDVYDPDLTIDGLRMIYERNRPNNLPCDPTPNPSS